MSKPPRLKRVASMRERIREGGGLGVSNETEEALGKNTRGPLGVLNRTVTIPAANLVTGALQLVGHGSEYLAEEADNLARRTGVADKLSWQGNKFLPGTAAMALAEAFPMGAPHGASVPAGVLASRARMAAPKVARVIKQEAKAALHGETGAVGNVAEATRRLPPAAKASKAKAKVAKAPPKPALKAKHYSFAPDLTETDPTYWGTNKAPGFISKEERATIGKAPPRTYFGLTEGEGVTKPYNREARVGPYGYEADLSDFNLLDVRNGGAVEQTARLDAIPQTDGFREHNGIKHYSRTPLIEQFIKEDGYDGYTASLGSQGADVASMFKPVPVRRIEQPIEGAPTKLGPYDPLRDSGRKYVADKGLEGKFPERYYPINEDTSTRLAQAYDEMPHAPHDPEVAEAYGALKSETLAHLKDLENRGYQFSFMDPANNPYPSPFDAVRDLRDNKRMQVYPTDAGFGAEEQFANHPLMETVPGVQWGGKPITYNDAFRAVHDAYGHAKEGFGFRAAGEENAAFQHLPMFSPPAQRALLSETRGQNSWVNYGPHGEHNRTASQEATRYADQKAGLLPDEVSLMGTQDFLPDPFSTAYGFRGHLVSDDGTARAARLRNDDGLKGVLAQRGVQADPLPEMPVPKAIVPEGFTVPQSAAIEAPNPSPVQATPAPGTFRSSTTNVALGNSKGGEGFTKWRAANDSGPGDLFDYSKLEEVPDVPQTPMLRYQAPRGPSKRIMGALSDPKVTRGINKRVRQGAEMGGKGWYNTEPLLRRFQDTLGEQEGASSFGRFMDAVAATSPRSSVPDNIRTASYYHTVRENGGDVNAPVAPGYGSIAQDLHRSNMDKLVNGDGWDIYANPKPASFSTNLQGNFANATIDTHNFRLPGILSGNPEFLATSVKAGTKGNRQTVADSLARRFPNLPGTAIDDAVKGVPVDGDDLASYRPREWVNQGYLSTEQAAKDPVLWDTKPKANEYAAYEDWQRKQAKALGMAPAQYQASMWVGAGDITGLTSPPEPFLRTFEARVKYTAAKRGISPEAVLDEFIKGKTPLLSAGAAAPVLGAMSQDDDQDPLKLP